MLTTALLTFICQKHGVVRQLQQQQKLQHHSLHSDNTVSSNETKALDHWATHLHCCIQSFGMLELFQQLVIACHLLPFLVHNNHVILKHDTPKSDRIFFLNNRKKEFHHAPNVHSNTQNSILS